MNPQGFKSSQTVTHVFLVILYVAHNCVAPFLSLYVKYLGLSVFEMGVIQGTQTWIAMIFVLLWATLAKRLHNRRWKRAIISLSIFITFAICVCLVYVPPKGVPLDVTHCTRDIPKTMPVNELSLLKKNISENLDHVTPSTSNQSLVNINQSHFRNTKVQYIVPLFKEKSNETSQVVPLNTLLNIFGKPSGSIPRINETEKKVIIPNTMNFSNKDYSSHLATSKSPVNFITSQFMNSSKSDKSKMRSHDFNYKNFQNRENYSVHYSDYSDSSRPVNSNKTTLLLNAKGETSIPTLSKLALPTIFSALEVFQTGDFKNRPTSVNYKKSYVGEIGNNLEVTTVNIPKVTTFNNDLSFSPTQHDISDITETIPTGNGYSKNMENYKHNQVNYTKLRVLQDKGTILQLPQQLHNKEHVSIGNDGGETTISFSTTNFNKISLPQEKFSQSSEFLSGVPEIKLSDEEFQRAGDFSGLEPQTTSGNKNPLRVLQHDSTGYDSKQINGGEWEKLSKIFFHNNIKHFQHTIQNKDLEKSTSYLHEERNGVPSQLEGKNQINLQTENDLRTVRNTIHHHSVKKDNPAGDDPPSQEMLETQCSQCTSYELKRAQQGQKSSDSKPKQCCKRYGLVAKYNRRSLKLPPLRMNGVIPNSPVAYIHPQNTVGNDKAIPLSHFSKLTLHNFSKSSDTKMKSVDLDYNVGMESSVTGHALEQNQIHGHYNTRTLLSLKPQVQEANYINSTNDEVHILSLIGRVRSVRVSWSETFMTVLILVTFCEMFSCLVKPCIDIFWRQQFEDEEETSENVRLSTSFKVWSLLIWGAVGCPVLAVLTVSSPCLYQLTFHPLLSAIILFLALLMALFLLPMPGRKTIGQFRKRKPSKPPYKSNTQTQHDSSFHRMWFALTAVVTGFSTASYFEFVLWHIDNLQGFPYNYEFLYCGYYAISTLVQIPVTILINEWARNKDIQNNEDLIDSEEDNSDEIVHFSYKWRASWKRELGLKLSDKPSVLVAVGHMFLAIQLSVLPLLQSAWLLLLLSPLKGCSDGLLESTRSSWGWTFGYGLGCMVGGLTVDMMGMKTLFWIAAAATFVWSVGCAVCQGLKSYARCWRRWSYSHVPLLQEQPAEEVEGEQASDDWLERALQQEEYRQAKSAQEKL